MNQLSILMSFVAVLAFSSFAYAQDDQDDAHNITVNIPLVTLLDIETAGGSKNITLSPQAPTEAGLGVDWNAATNSDLWLNYTSVINKAYVHKVRAKISSGSAPQGTKLRVVASPYSGTGEGTPGTPTAEIELSGGDKDFITGIGSCYTGNGANNGHNLTYRLVMSAGKYHELDATNSTTITVLYTMMN